MVLAGKKIQTRLENVAYWGAFIFASQGFVQTLKKPDQTLLPTMFGISEAGLRQTTNETTTTDERSQGTETAKTTNNERNQGAARTTNDERNEGAARPTNARRPTRDSTYLLGETL